MFNLNLGCVNPLWTLIVSRTAASIRPGAMAATDRGRAMSDGWMRDVVAGLGDEDRRRLLALLEEA